MASLFDQVLARTSLFLNEAVPGPTVNTANGSNLAMLPPLTEADKRTTSPHSIRSVDHAHEARALADAKSRDTAYNQRSVNRGM